MKFIPKQSDSERYSCGREVFKSRTNYFSKTMNNSFAFTAVLLALICVTIVESTAQNGPDIVDERDGNIPIRNPTLVGDNVHQPPVFMRQGPDPDATDPPQESEGNTSATIKKDDEAAQKPDPQSSNRGDRETREAIGSLFFVAIVASVCVVAFVAFVGGAYCWYKHMSLSSATRRVFYRSSDASVLIHNDYQPMDGQCANEITENGRVSSETQNHDLTRLAEKTDYPAYGVTGPNPLHYIEKGPPIDKNLNRNAEVYHYQQQKQKLKALSSASSEASARSRPSTSDTLNELTTETNEDDEENSDGEYTVYECPGLASTTDGPMEIHNPLFADSELSFTSYRTPLTNNMTSSKLNYSPTVTNQG